jgi:hypothetical protein
MNDFRATVRFALAAACLLGCGVASSAEAPTEPPATSFSFNASYYAMRDEPDFGVYVAAVQHGPFRLEARYNYEARSATSVFAGYNWSGGTDVEWSVTPILGGLFGSARGVIPGVEASVSWRQLDLYVEAEYVIDGHNRDDSYFYAWTELGWRPVEALRIGFVGQRTRIVSNDRDLQRGVFAQLSLGPATVGIFAFNPEAASRYVVLSLAFAL